MKESGLNLSYSSISTYLQCPLKFYFSQILKFESPFQQSSMLLGRCVHDSIRFALERFRHDRKIVNVVQLQDYFSGVLKRQIALKEVKYSKTDFGPDKLRRTGMNLLNAWLSAFRNDAPIINSVLAIEKKFILDITDPETGRIIPFKLTGVWDAIFEYARWPNSAFAPDIRERKFPIILLLDWKTSSSRYAETRIKYNTLQQDCYIFAAKQNGLIPAHMHDRIITGNGTMIKRIHPTYELYLSRRTRDDEIRFLRIASWVATAVQLGIFYPSPNSLVCPTMCEHEEACKKW